MTTGHGLQHELAGGAAQRAVQIAMPSCVRRPAEAANLGRWEPFRPCQAGKVLSPGSWPKSQRRQEQAQVIAFIGQSVWMAYSLGLQDRPVFPGQIEGSEQHVPDRKVD